MKFQNTLEVLKKQAGDIGALAEDMAREQEIRAIDLDLLLEKLRAIYDVALELKHIPSAPTPQLHIPTPAIAVTTPVPPPEVNNTVPKAPLVEEKAPEAPPVIAPQTEAKTPETELHTKQPLLADQFNNPTTLNEEIQSRQTLADISSKLQTQPISSITGAIGLNEKFELINELFHGDHQQFHETMETLNRFGSFIEAYAYLEEDLKWDMNAPYVQRILELIRRKLIVRRHED